MPTLHITHQIHLYYRTETGQKLNHAMFAAFDQMYDDISYLLGQAVAQQLQSEQL
ncbi:hypothetical protein [Roseovarius albus]|uniref:hypothetical protein n=1 Tax=Roseovarius albus TaxID=1247867 RepID=UPI0013565623|nr:hypothetical protein [Roseovarius albus]